ncbi:MAG: thiamine pyrophosphate-binding protein [Alphaproteobacteria bacterium]|jgi:acetolactate synthase-1/2/3 large subunit|nr:thiamine pyrophosphate-binding protein [Alphaproteobacteria bacterium]MDP6254803.1 thiamine pyrophosphate-binding protein [Alphaproteobacteria bacterium]MDP7054843.1 thiamine pyrophosphate-binding protein [Alphaproteobacteria bacterium]MDP7227878.1 thiamine pyrophosphate-binding protein [Alphaproteobacteria bacterium]MDP7461885.1 thiamine pyrophosphate-binding protein [Alphaproteobacteria bacterium]|tara:strand:+ start:3642 stop:5405 length:1764 start_codon:yes stop_codon:yes gene_type:complete
MKGGELIAQFLVQEKIPYVFGICGHGTVGLLDALYDVRDEVKLISPRHEQVAAHMADAYFRIKHEPVATLTSCGPGSANIVMPIANALADSSAILALTANIPTQQFNRGPFQEINRHFAADFPSVLKPVVKRSFQPTRVDMLPLSLRQALELSVSGRPGPVQVDVPFNVFQEEADVRLEATARFKTRKRPGTDPADIDQALAMLGDAERPALFIGHGVSLAEAAPELVELAERLNIPVISSPNGMGCIPMSHSLSLGFIGRNGTFPANQAGRHADLVIAVGARFDDRSSSSWIPGYSWNFPSTKLIHVDIDVNEIGRNYLPDLGITSDAGSFLRQMLGAAAETEIPVRKAWLAEIEGWRDEWQRFTAPNFELRTSPLRPEQIVADIRAVLPDDGIISLDSGVHHNWFMQFWDAPMPQTMLNAWGFSGMGFGVSGILGAKLAAPDRPCVSICGDGGFTMTPHVLCTAVEFDIPCIWVVWNNFAWGAIRDIQYGMFGGREHGTGFYRGDNQQPYNPDFAAMARSCGVHGVTVTEPDDFKGALEAAIAFGKPALLDVHVDPEVRPPATGTWQLPPTPFGEPAFGGPLLQG